LAVANKLKIIENNKFHTFNSLKTEDAITSSAIAKARYGASFKAVVIHSTFSALFPISVSARFVKIS
jgi:hypothetical protein